jgi:hypothetical protein
MAGLLLRIKAWHRVDKRKAPPNPKALLQQSMSTTYSNTHLLPLEIGS